MARIKLDISTVFIQGNRKKRQRLLAVIAACVSAASQLRWRYGLNLLFVLGFRKILKNCRKILYFYVDFWVFGVKMGFMKKKRCVICFKPRNTDKFPIFIERPMGGPYGLEVDMRITPREPVCDSCIGIKYFNKIDWPKYIREVP